MAVKTTHEGRFSKVLIQAMRERNEDIRSLAAALGVSYEHIRKLVAGVAYPSKWLRKEICKHLGMNDDAVEQMLVADRIENKWGGIPHQLVGKHPELSLMAPFWDALTPEQKDMVRSTVKNFANENQRRVRHAS